MKKFNALILICAVLTAAPVWAGVSLQLPEDLTMVAANGKNTRISGSASLPDGVNQIVVYLKKVFESKPFDKNAEINSSDAFVIKFQARNEALRLKMPAIEDTFDLDRFNKKPNIKIVNAAGQAITIHTQKLSHNGLQFNRNFEEELKQFNASNSPAAVQTATDLQRQPDPDTSSAGLPTKPAAKPQPHATGDSAAASNTPNMAEEMLKYWYQQADEKTRQKFKIWLERQ